jgi:CRP/FNR family cyclic AMP-dependent transcriptional regulator
VPQVIDAPPGAFVVKHDTTDSVDLRAQPVGARLTGAYTPSMARDEKLEHLKRVPLFAHMGRRELERIGQLADEVEVGLDKILAEKGHLGQEFFFVLDGRLSVLDGNRVINHLGPGDFFGEIALLDGHQRTATVRADGIARLLVIGHSEFNALMDEFPSVRAAVLQAVAERLRKVEGESGRT